MTAADLEPELRSAVPACRLVPDRLLRRILHELQDLDRPVVINTRLPWWVHRADLTELDDLHPGVTSGEEDPLLLLVDPDDRPDLCGTDRDIRSAYQQMILHAVVCRRVADAVAAGSVNHRSAAALFQSVHWDYEPDGRSVLVSDHVVPPDAGWETFFPRFAATAWVWLETEPDQFASVFPSAPPPAAARAVLARMFDSTGLPPVRSGVAPPAAGSAAPDERIDRSRATRWAEIATRKRNHVRAAICWHAAGEDDKAGTAIRDGLMPLLAPALGLDAGTAEKWVIAILPLLGSAGQGAWPHAARALYNLQKLGLDLAGGLVAVDPTRWLKSFGKRSVKLPLDRALPVLRYRALASAHRHVERAALPSNTADPFLHLVDAALHRAEAEAFADFTPRLVAALDAVGLVPANVVERIARDKLVVELVERACRRGFLRFGDLRDALARNSLKLPDLRGPGEFVAGDPLLRADKVLSESLAGVYHGGEFYLRGIQRMSSLAFGTPPGRLVTRFIALPFGGAFLLLEFAQHMVHAAQGAYRFASKLLAPKPLPVVVEAPAEAPPAEPEWYWDWAINDWMPNFDTVEAATVVKATVTSVPTEHGPHLVTWPVVLAVGLFLLALLHVPAFRSRVVDGLAAVWRGFRYLVHDLPLSVWTSEPVRRVRRHPVMRAVNRRFGSGLLVAVFAAGMLWVFGASPGRIARGAVLWFLLVTLVRLLPAGRMAEDRAAEALADGWRLLRVNLLPGLVGWFVWVFREFLAWVERVLYAVDEWFRFHEGESKPSDRYKVLLGFVWFPVAYVVRFVFNLLLEPQVNPVKHFPVVTVSHKVLFTALIPLSDATGIPEATLAVIFTGIPGVFGFLAWELKENWRIYAANRPAGLKPVVLGHHGETMRGLLRPGFHSGTVPKQLKSIRKQLAHPPGDRKEHAIAKAVHELHHIEHAVGRFVEREILPLLRASRAWAGVDVRAGHVRLTTTAAAVELLAATGDGGPISVTFRNEGEGIVAHVDPDALRSFGPDRARALTAGVKGAVALGAATPDVDLGSEFTWDEWVAFWERESA